jgi:AraC-like DNA-binding protein
MCYTLEKGYDPTKFGGEMGDFVRFLSAHHYRFMHCHSEGEGQRFEKVCLGFVVKGSAEFLYKGRAYTAREGDLLYIAKGTDYYSVWNGKPEIEFYSIVFDFQDPYAKKEYKFQIIPAAHLKEKFETIYQSLRSDSFFEAMALFYGLLDSVYPCLLQKSGHSVKKPILPAISHLEKNYKDKLDVAQLAALCGFSESRFFSLFKEATGSTPIGYKHNLLIREALELLSETSLSIDEISWNLGFSSPAYFRRIFRKVTGQTPKSIRTEKKNKAC